MLGRGDAQGRLVVRVAAFSNNQTQAPQGSRVLVLQSLPWVLRPWLHALHVQIEGAPGALWAFGGPLDCGSWVQQGRARQRPAAVGVCVTLPVGATAVRVVVPFAKGFMHVDEHPPDSERGVDVPSAMAWLETPQGHYTVRVHLLLCVKLLPMFSESPVGIIHDETLCRRVGGVLSCFWRRLISPWRTT